MGVTPSPSHSFSHARGSHETRENNTGIKPSLGCLKFGVEDLQTKEHCWLDSKCWDPTRKSLLWGHLGVGKALTQGVLGLNEDF